jgi:hypothetical protein
MLKYLRFLLNLVIATVAVVLGGQREPAYVDEGFREYPDWDTGGMVFRTYPDGTWAGTR